MLASRCRCYQTRVTGAYTRYLLANSVNLSACRNKIMQTAKPNLLSISMFIGDRIGICSSSHPKSKDGGKAPNIM